MRSPLRSSRLPLRGLRVTLRALDDGAGPALYVGGDFSHAGFVPANGIARRRCEPTCYADCNTSTGPGALDIFDFLCFQDAFVAGCP